MTIDVILSIKPKYVDAILRGYKKYEFRKTIFRNKDIGSVYIYSSSPVKKIVAVFDIKNIIEDDPKALWDRYKDLSGLDNDEFLKYFKYSKKGFAIEIDHLEKLRTPIDPKKVVPGFVPPQSFCYIETSLLLKVSNYLSRGDTTTKIDRIGKQNRSAVQSKLAEYLLKSTETK